MFNLDLESGCNLILLVVSSVGPTHFANSLLFSNSACFNVFDLKKVPSANETPVIMMIRQVERFGMGAVEKARRMLDSAEKIGQFTDMMILVQSMAATKSAEI